MGCLRRANATFVLSSKYPLMLATCLTVPSSMNSVGAMPSSREKPTMTQCTWAWSIASLFQTNVRHAKSM